MESKHLTAKRAWLGLGAAIVTYDMLCPAGQTLSEGVDQLMERHRLATAGAIGLVALHLGNALPPPVDPIHVVFKYIKG